MMGASSFVAVDPRNLDPQDDMTRPRILFTCGREAGYVRNLLIRRALRQQFDVVDVTDDTPGSLLLRHLKLLPRLLKALTGDQDLVFVGFYGQMLAWSLSQLTRKPIVFDAFLSTYDTLCFDRARFGPHSIRGELAFLLDSQSCRAATHCLLDTEVHKNYFVDRFGLADSKISAFYVGYDQELFYPRPAARSDDCFTVFYYGSFLPLQGIDYIVRAAKLLETEQDIEFRIVGGGMMYPYVHELADELHVQRLTFGPAMPYRELPAAIAEASVCLGGPFGSTAKAHRVIASKTYQFLAMRKPTIVGDSKANHELFTHREDVWMCKMADPQALASAILEMKRDASLRARIAQRGYERCRDQFGMEKQGQRMAEIMSALL